MKCLKFLALAAAVVAVALPTGAAQHVHANLPQPAALFASATADVCTNHQGPFITLSGDVTLGGVDGRLIFRNNLRGTHEAEEEVTVDVSLLPPGTQIRFNKQPSRGGVGGNPWIWVQFDDGGGNPISDEALLGRCVQGLDPTAIEFLLPTDADVDVTTGNCSGAGGPTVTLEGALTLGGLDATIYFRNNEKGTHEHEEETEVSITILDAGQSITIAKQPPLGGVGGNPHIWFQFLDGNGDPYGGEIYLGRCNKL